MPHFTLRINSAWTETSRTFYSIIIIIIINIEEKKKKVVDAEKE